MATLQELRPALDQGKEIVLFLAHDHPLNAERENVKIFVKKVSDSTYSRRLVYIDREHPLRPPEPKILTWRELTDSESALAEATSDQWTIHQP